ncbi:hypothetical protein J2Z22_003231 [Paenibacillus forsythiae]|uniref:Uncharacterized protein n=1 Tax=Paenibacillus forsythiae TaxID=365616 RepID=A0ABU3HA27_9BACL|nr:hypothetical protein [Paenibacillus forsythiae]MDT3427668.1 hypothetical protein [Paenibacillus forsythiae]
MLITTLFYYIAANRELPTGSFGQKKTVMKLGDYLTHVNPSARNQFAMQRLLEKYPEDEQIIDIYETVEDAAGIYVSGPISHQDTSHLLRYPWVYQVDPEGGSFRINNEMQKLAPDSYLTSKKCLTELFDYLNRNMEPGDSIELYSCWAHGAERFLEPRQPELDLVLDLSTFRLEEEFAWRERQYILVKK